MLPELANRGIHREAFLVGGQRKCGTHSPARPHVRGSRKAQNWATRAKPGKSENLKEENAAVREEIEQTEAEIGGLVQTLESPKAAKKNGAAKGKAKPKAKAAAGDAQEFSASNGAKAKPDNPGDYWTPQGEDLGEFVEQPGALSPLPEHDGTDCLKWDDSLWSHADHFRYRWNVYKGVRAAIEANEGGMDKFSQGYKTYGLNRGEKDGQQGIWYREWAPGARALALVGEFNNWEPRDGQDWATKNDFGTWTLFLPDAADGTSAIPHRTKVKARLETAYGEWVERIPAWIKWATQEWNEIQFNGVYYAPPNKGLPGAEPTFDTSYTFKYARPSKPEALRIYECHVGMSSAEAKINSYTGFRKEMLPRIRDLGYNAVQIMAVQEHAYYGSFGYHVTNFFAASSRFGTPDELKAMIDEAHRLGLLVLMDIVHSHASKNSNDGINMFDGTDAGYFHGGGRGYHWMWDSRCFNYGNWETLRFLLANSRWWIDEYKFDGYRFDGVTSMMYHHHGLQMAFSGGYDEYFGPGTDVEAVVYMMIMNQMLHDMFPNIITVGEDVSGMPTFSRPVSEGGVGFDYRLQMAIADKWVDILETLSDHDWNMGNIVHTLTNRRYAEPCVGYAESHDQALVGSKTISFWLMDKDMYDKMAINETSQVVDRGIALHKMIRLITMALGGNSYLNFMGNEFGHPEWIDFPRDDTYDPSTGKLVPGNGGSLDKCRRRWDLAENPDLKYRYMNAFDRAMNHLDKAFSFIASPHEYVSQKSEGDKIIIAERGQLVFVFNFHPTNSYSDYRVGCKTEGPYKIVLSSDEEVFGGWKNVSKEYDVDYQTEAGDYNGRPNSFLVYAPSRTVAVYAPSKYADAFSDRTEQGIPGLGVKNRGPEFES